MLTEETPQPRRKIFLSYRRADHPDFVERMYDWFVRRYERDNVFMDFDAIPPFTRFADVIRDRVRESDILIAIIGPNWLDYLRERQESPDEDYVRIEIRLALEEGKPIAPICIKGAHPPRRRDLPPDLQPMMDYHVAYLNSGREFLDNIERTVEAVEELLARLEMFSSVKRDLEPYQQYRGEFDIQAAISSFQDAADRGDWYTARDLLDQIRHSGFMPRFYPIDDYEQEVREGIENMEALREYNIIRMMVERVDKGREDPGRVWAALQTFWQAHPTCDPDDLATRFRPSGVVLGDLVDTESVMDQRLKEYAHQPPLPAGQPVQQQAVDVSIFDQLDSLDESEADELFDPDALASLARELSSPQAMIDFEAAEELGIAIPALEE